MTYERSNKYNMTQTGQKSTIGSFTKLHAHVMMMQNEHKRGIKDLEIKEMLHYKKIKSTT